MPLEYIAAIERELGKEIKKNMLPMQAGDVAATHADTSARTTWLQAKNQH